MTDKERIERIVYKAERTALLTKPPKPLVTVPDEDFEWLIAQAELNVEYRRQMSDMRDKIAKQRKEINDMRDKRHRQQSYIRHLKRKVKSLE